MGWQPLSDDDHEQMVAAWLEALSVSGVPVKHFDSCYRAARQTQIERKGKGESTGPLSAEDLAVEWVKLRELHAEMEREGQKVKMLAENAAHACERCLGTGTDPDPDGARPCDHVPLTPEEKAERDSLRDEKLSWLREQMKHVMRPKPVEKAAAPKPPAGVWLKCTKCPRKINVLYVDEPGRPCGALVNASTSDAGDDGEVGLCDGTLIAA